MFGPHVIRRPTSGLRGADDAIDATHPKRSVEQRIVAGLLDQLHAQPPGDCNRFMHGNLAVTRDFAELAVHRRAGPPGVPHVWVWVPRVTSRPLRWSLQLGERASSLEMQVRSPAHLWGRGSHRSSHELVRLLHELTQSCGQVLNNARVTVTDGRAQESGP